VSLEQDHYQLVDFLYRLVDWMLVQMGEGLQRGLVQLTGRVLLLYSNAV
jgi:hypothetical protein